MPPLRVRKSCVKKVPTNMSPAPDVRGSALVHRVVPGVPVGVNEPGVPLEERGRGVAGPADGQVEHSVRVSGITNIHPGVSRPPTRWDVHYLLIHQQRESELEDFPFLLAAARALGIESRPDVAKALDELAVTVETVRTSPSPGCSASQADWHRQAALRNAEAVAAGRVGGLIMREIASRLGISTRPMMGPVPSDDDDGSVRLGMLARLGIVPGSGWPLPAGIDVDEPDPSEAAHE